MSILIYLLRYPELFFSSLSKAHTFVLHRCDDMNIFVNKHEKKIDNSVACDLHDVGGKWNKINKQATLSSNYYLKSNKIPAYLSASVQNLPYYGRFHNIFLFASH